MRGALLFEPGAAGRKLTRFWVLLLLSAVIASAGVIGDSTATVIGAMIVAPLMTPILGTALSVVTADALNAARCAALVVTGAAAVVAIGWVIGLMATVDVVAATNSQVSGRVSPRLIDLVAALATGAVGAFALVREDVSDTLPGVAIAISLVPPLAVVGLTLEAGAGDEARGALLLFLTNVGAILLSGIAVMALYHVPAAVRGRPRSRLDVRVGAIVAVAAVVALALPLAEGSRRIATQAVTESDVSASAGGWAEQRGWDIVGVDQEGTVVVVRAVGPLPIPDPGTLRAALDSDGLDDVDIRVELAPTTRVDLPGR